MHDQLIAAIVRESAPVLLGRTLGKVWLAARATLVLDFRLHAARYLLIAAAPNESRIHLVRRTVRELERQALAPDPFLLTLRKQLAGATLLSLTKDEGERVVRCNFAACDVIGAEHKLWLIAQLTGRAANVFLLDEAERIVAALRPPYGAGQEIGARYQPPPPHAARAAAPEATPPFAQDAYATLSEAADAFYLQRDTDRAFAAHASALTAQLRQEITRREKLQRNLERDLAAHGDPTEHKRVGDLLLANIATAERTGSRVRLTDYYAEGAPVIELEIDEHATLQAEAARRFARYSKAKRAAQEIGARLAALQTELAALATRRAELEQLIATGDATALAAFTTQADKGAGRRNAEQRSARHEQGRARGKDKEAGKATEQAKVARRYQSSDGYEMLVGRGARENDQLTFRVARPHDLWLHAADYPGSHVIVRNPQRTDNIPHRTVVEAAQLAAQYSHAKHDAKVAVHYTQRKFVAKPKGGAPGLVRMANFRTLLVEPRESGERL